MFLVFIVVSSVSCSHLPVNVTDAVDTLSIYPDYKDVTVPCNIAPLNFSIKNEASSYLIRIYSKKGKDLLIKGKEVQIPLNDWKALLKANKGDSIFYDIFLKRGRTWSKYPVFSNSIAEDSIDKFVVYRNIQPLYTTYEDMTINQRNLENFDVKVLYDNRLLSTEKEGQCVNCHSFQDYNKRGNMQMHFRGKIGGTVVVQGDKQKKVNQKPDGLISGTVYPSWHPMLNLIAYSVNKIGQNFHTKNLDKVEVLDSKSDLVLYDVDNDKITPIVISVNGLETFPYWSPDGKFLYYVVANYVPKTENLESDVIEHYQNIRYNLVRKSFDPNTRIFGATDTLLRASSLGKSITFPRVTPDGKYVLFTMGDYGNFHIWHKSSDLYLMDLETRQYRNLAEVNSPNMESYHSWSSNGHWIVFSSRRDDGSFTRLYLSFFDKNGKAHKPFVLPQKDPNYYQTFFKSYNIPEFIVKPTSTNRHRLVHTIKGAAVKAVL